MLKHLKRLYHLLPAPPSTNFTFRGATAHHAAVSMLPPNAVIFDIGSKDERGQYGSDLPPDAKVVCVDIAPGPGVDLVADAHDLHMVPDNSVDYVVSISTLEHVRYPQTVVAEIYRVLKPGGMIYISVPFLFPFHADPHDFYRFTNKGVDILCEQFERIDSGFNRGPASTMHHLFVHFFAMLFSFNSRTIYGINVDLFKWLLFWVKYLDVFLAKYDMAYVIHAGAYFFGMKPR